jgi:hypothetical protein
MRKENFLAIFFFLIVFVRNGYAFDDADFQYWNTESLSWKVNKDWKISLDEEFRFGDDAEDLYYQHSDLGLTYSGIAEWLELGLNYRHIFEEKSSKWKVENRPHLNAAFKWNFFDFDLSNRARFEYRNRQDTQDYWRYRNKFTIKFPLKLTKFKIQPYIADEIFFDFDAEDLNRNRLYSGLIFKILKDLNAEIYYFWERTEKSNQWVDVNVLGTKLKLFF